MAVLATGADAWARGHVGCHVGTKAHSLIDPGRATTGAVGAATATGGEHAADGEEEGGREVAQMEGELTQRTRPWSATEGKVEVAGIVPRAAAEAEVRRG